MDAATPPTPPMSPEQAKRVLQGEALKRLGRLLLIGGAAGAGWRGIQELRALPRTLESPVRPKPGVILTDYPLSRGPDRDNEKRAISSLTEPWGSDLLSIPLYEPAGLLTGVGSVYGGWKLMDKVLRDRQDAHLNKQLAQAEADFKRLLAREGKPQEDNKPGEKRAQAANDTIEKLASVLDRLYDRATQLQPQPRQKQADNKPGFWGKRKPLAGKALSKYLAYWGIPSFLVAAHVSRRRAQEKALARSPISVRRHRDRARYNLQPPAVYMMSPQAPMLAGNNGRGDDDE